MERAYISRAISDRDKTKSTATDNEAVTDAGQV